MPSSGRNDTLIGGIIGAGLATGICCLLAAHHIERQGKNLDEAATLVESQRKRISDRLGKIVTCNAKATKEAKEAYLSEHTLGRSSYASQWSTENLRVPMTFLANYVADEGKKQLTAADKQDLIKEWEELTDDQMGFWHYHASLHGGNFQNYLTEKVAPTLEKRLAILQRAELANPNLGRFIENILADIQPPASAQ